LWCGPTELMTFLGRTYYLGVRGLISGDVEHSGVSPGGRITQIGLLWFFVLVTSFYTANLTTILVSQNIKPTVSSLSDAIGARYTICTKRNRMSMLMLRYPGIRFATNPLDGELGMTLQTQLADGIDEGYCDAAIMELEELEMRQSQEMHCDKMPVGPSIAKVAKGVPISNNDKLSLTLHYHIQEVVNEGKFEQFVARHRPKPTCSNIGSPSPTMSLSAHDLAGTFVLAVAFGIVGCFVTLFCGSDGKRTVNLTAKGAAVTIEGSKRAASTLASTPSSSGIAMPSDPVVELDDVDAATLGRVQRNKMVESS